MKSKSLILTVLLTLVLAAPATAYTPPPKITIEVTATPTQVARGGTTTYSPVEYKVSGSVEGSNYSYAVSVLNRNVWPYNNCSARAKKEASFEGVYGESIAGSGTKTFSHEGFVPGELYEAKGEYLICAWVEAFGEVHAQSTAVIQVAESTKEAVTKEEAKAKEAAEREAEEAAKRKATEEYQAKVKAEEEAAVKRKAEEAAKAPSLSSLPLSPAPVVTPTAPPVVAPGVQAVNPLTASQKLHAALAKCKKQYKHNKKKRGKCERQAKKKHGPEPKRH